jgi:hypothetical protein
MKSCLSFHVVSPTAYFFRVMGYGGGEMVLGLDERSEEPFC